MALFGEKYGDVVRVVEVPGVSLELCGGTHVRSTGQIGLFKIVSETGVAAGIRRIEALTGPAAYERVVEVEDRLNRVAGRLRVAPADVEERVGGLLEEREELEEALSDLRGEEAADLAERLVDRAEELPDGGRLLVEAEVDLPAGAEAAEFGDRVRDALGSGAAVLHLVWPDEEKSAFLAVVSDDWIQRGVRAGDLVREASQATGSGGGGKAHFAQGGVGDPDRVDDGLEAARRHARSAAGEPAARG